MIALPLPPPREPLLDPNTGLVSRPWYDYFEAVRKAVVTQEARIASIEARLAAAGIP